MGKKAPSSILRTKGRAPITAPAKIRQLRPMKTFAPITALASILVPSQMMASE
jgi:hypothetical protein